MHVPVYLLKHRGFLNSIAKYTSCWLLQDNEFCRGVCSIPRNGRKQRDFIPPLWAQPRQWKYD